MHRSGDRDSPLRVCIVGGGPSGILSARQMLDEGFQPIIYEMSSSLGGLWAYRDHSEEGVPSIMRSTVFNSSKEMSAFSDFPPPKETPNYMQHTKVLEYIRSYADHFGITSKIRLRHEVLRVTQAEDYDSTGRWDVVVKDLNGGVERRDTFDAVLVASGHNGFPNVPTFKGKEKFKGKIVHTHRLKVPDQFKDRRVAVVGIGNSGIDAAVDVSRVAAEVTKLDAVILATGYKIKFPMLSEDVVPAVDKQVQLYKHVFPPGLEHPTLAIIGLVKGAGSPLPLIELQARWVAQLLAGKCKLPPHPEMFHGIARERAPLRRRSGNSYDTSLHVDRMKYMDDLAEMIGASPRMLKYFFTDHKLFRALLGPCVPYQFRLEGPHSWTNAISSK